MFREASGHPTRHFRLQIVDCRLAQVEVKVEVEDESRYEPDSDFSPTSGDDARRLEGAGIKFDVAGIPPGLPEEPVMMK